MKVDCKIHNNPTRFSDQLNRVIHLFQEWNDCERAVMLYALLKKVPFPITKFLQSVIDTNVQQALSKEQAKILERNANCAKYINSLSETYKSFKYNDTHFTAESIFFASDRSIDNVDKYYDKKEEILHDISKMIPILAIGNDDAKFAYLEFIPMTVIDATRRLVNSTLVQQILCYVLIHPAFSTEDRSSVGKYLKVLESHISSNGSSPTSEPTNPFTSNWHLAIAPPQSKSTETIPSLSPWGSSHHLTRVYIEENDYSSQSIQSSSCYYDTSTDDHHTSFQRNGKIVDVDVEDGDIQIGFPTYPGVAQHLNHLISLPRKTKRSTSLTPPIQTTETPAAPNPNGKPRSFSMSGISGRQETDESKQVFQLPQYPQIGMSNIAAWLKQLRLHKYHFLFFNQTYEQMLGITEEHLMNVTKGARTKLVNCIQRLKERFGVLCQMEEDLLFGQITIGKAVDDLNQLYLTPMKPIEQYNKHDVASQFLKVLNLVSTKMTSKHIVPQDEESVTTLLVILDKSVHNEAFVAHTNLLKTHRFNLQRIKNQFPPKSHYSKSNALSSSSSNNIHNRQRKRPIKLNDYLPTKNIGQFSGGNRFIGSIDPKLSYSTVTKYYKPFSLESEKHTDDDRSIFKVPQLPEKLTDDQSIFKVPQLPATPTPFHLRKPAIGCSVNSIYHPHGHTVDANNEPKKGNDDSSTDSRSEHYGSLESFTSGYVSDDMVKVPERRIDDIFKKPQPVTPAPTPLYLRKQTIGGSVESDISGYHSDGCHTGMSNIGKWLKSLRLHKYTWVFDGVRYEEMFTFTEEYFKSLNITQGASHKLAICIEKLKTRNEAMNQMELNLGKSRMYLHDAIAEMDAIVLSPMKPMQVNCETNVGFRIWKVITMVFNLLLSTNHYEEQHIQPFQRVLELSMNSEAFIKYAATLREMRMKLATRMGRRMIR